MTISSCRQISQLFHGSGTSLAMHCEMFEKGKFEVAIPEREKIGHPDGLLPPARRCKHLTSIYGEKIGRASHRRPELADRGCKHVFLLLLLFFVFLFFFSFVFFLRSRPSSCAPSSPSTSWPLRQLGVFIRR